MQILARPSFELVGVMELKKSVKRIRNLLIIGLYIWFSCAMLVFHGPFPNVRNFVLGALATSRHGYLLRPISFFTISQATINQYNPKLTTFTKTYTNSTIANEDFRGVADSSITQDTYQKSTFTATVLLIRDPKRVRVAVTHYLGKVGQTVSEIAAENHAVAAINGGGFEDTHWQGTGGMPDGITIVNGKQVESYVNARDTVAGITANGALIAGSYSLNQLKALNVTQALSFEPVLVQNGVDMIQGVGTWGFAPRTAIGQTKDGTIIMAITDGRGIHGLNNVGASLQDMAQLMLHYGAVTAMNLDGGSSTTMVYNGKLVNEPTDILGEREVATAFIVMPEGQ